MALVVECHSIPRRKKNHNNLPRRNNNNILGLFCCGYYCFVSTAFASFVYHSGTTLGLGLFGTTLTLGVGTLRNQTLTSSVKTREFILDDSTTTTMSNTTVVGKEIIGGGSINEKKRTYGEDSPSELENSDPKPSSSTSSYEPAKHRSHLYHALEGLDRYPNYLSRWNSEDTESLEHELERVLQKVRDQKHRARETRRSMRDILEDFWEEHPEWKDFAAPPKSWEDLRQIFDMQAAKAIFRSRMVRTMMKEHTIQDLLAGRVPNNIDLDTALLGEWLDEELYDVYSFPLLSEEFCGRLTEYTSSLLSYIASRNNVQRSSIQKDLDHLGLGWLSDVVFHLITKPVAAQLFGETELEGGSLDWKQGFVAAYSSDPTASRPRQRLVAHTDDAEVTLNLCFGDDFDGGDLKFWGVRGDSTAGEFLGQYEPQIGRAVVHSGRHLHEVTPITKGNRYAYIMWARSWSSARSRVCPCCWLNGRRIADGTASSCICGKRWN